MRNKDLCAGCASLCERGVYHIMGSEKAAGGVDAVNAQGGVKTGVLQKVVYTFEAMFDFDR